MVTPTPSFLFGRHEFLIRRLHSLTGLMPIGGYLFFHLATNASILDGPQAYQYRADQLHRLGPTTIVLLEWPLIFLPILFHGLIGLAIVARGKRNVTVYPYLGNIRYTLQRATGVVAFVFIVWHVWQMHGWLKFEAWRAWMQSLGGAQFDPADAAATAAGAVQDSAWVVVCYTIGLLACVYHLANGLWTMGITWGVWTSPNAQRWANVPCAMAGVFLAAMGLGALYGMLRVEVAPRSTVKAIETTRDQPRLIEAPSPDLTPADVVGGASR